MALTNAELKMLKSLRTGRGSAERRLFLAEGVRLLEESIRFRVRPQAVYVATNRLGERGVALAQRLKRARIEVTTVPSTQMDAVCDTEASQGILAVFNRPDTSLEQLGRTPPRTVLICDGISDPGNLGTLLRSALAFGFTLIALCGETAEAYAPKVVRSSAGAIFGLSIATVTTTQMIDWMHGHGYKLMAADQRGEPLATVAATIRRTQHLALAVGSEARGLSPEIARAAAHRIRVAHDSTVESLNAAVAGSILMKECYDLCHTKSS
jgi:TrmH family RNA methyltransferase